MMVGAVATRTLELSEVPCVSPLIPKAHMNDPLVIELTLKSSAEVFDAAMPACLGPKVFHEDIAEHLLEQVAAAPGAAPVKLIVNLPAAEAAQADAISAAVRAYFEDCRDVEQRRLRRILWDGRFVLVIALTFLLLGNVLGESIRAAFTGRFANAVANGLEIFSWVAMWRPAELLLYDWVPVRRKKSLLARLANMEIECRAIQG